MSNIDQTRLNVQFLLPLNEIVTNFYDELKSITSGYASFDYEDAGYQQSSLVKLGEKSSAVKRSIGFTIAFHNHREDPY